MLYVCLYYNSTIGSIGQEKQMDGVTQDTFNRLNKPEQVVTESLAAILRKDVSLGIIFRARQIVGALEKEGLLK